MTEYNHPTAEYSPQKKQAPTHELGGAALNLVLSGEHEPHTNIEKLFEADKLLVRALDPMRLFKNQDGSIGLDYSTVDAEFDDIENSENGLHYASSTLLVPDKRVPTYKGFGFIFDGEKSKIHHISTIDSASSGQDDNFRASESDAGSLPELADKVRKETTPPMNEIVASFHSDSLQGLFTLEAPRPFSKVNAWLMQQHLQEKTGTMLPLYSYTIKTGSIEHTEYNPQEMQNIVDQSFRENSSSHTAYTEAITAIAARTTREK